MSFDLGEAIRRAREAKGWNQGELARRLQVTQQTVSRWERGHARPRSPVLLRLSELLERPLNDFAVAAAASRPAASPKGALVSDWPVSPLEPTLPLDKLAPERFEHFVADLARLLHPDADASLVGAQGHAQGGIDVEVRRAGKRIATFQCKRHKEFGPAKAAKAIASVTVSADRHHLVITRVASPRVQDEVAKHPGWQLWDIHYVAHVVRHELDRDAAIRLVDTYFPGWRERFLGVGEASPWLTPDEFFRPFTSELFTHRWPLAGRRAELDKIEQFVTDRDAPAGLVIGRGGIGKTRLLREVAEMCPGLGVTVRFAETGDGLAAESLESLPSTEPLLIVVDDAHDHEQLRRLLMRLRRSRPASKLLLATRPHGTAAVLSALQDAGVEVSLSERWELSDLAFDDARELATSVLGHDHAQLADYLATTTRDCPLVTVIAAGLIRRGDLSPAELQSGSDIRTQVLGLFQDALVAPDGDGALRHAVLDGMAAMQPFRAADPDFQQALAALVGLPYDRVVPTIRSLEDAGVLQRRGDSLRVVPDLLGDVLLARACYDDRSRGPTGYLDRVRDAASGTPLQNVFVNASRIDWQLAAAAPGPSLSDELWDAVTREFQAGGVEVRLGVLHLVERVAIYRPDQALRLARCAHQHPAERVEEKEVPCGLPRLTHADVLRALPPVLRQAGIHLDHLGDAADLLWRLAQHDTRPTHPHPDHALRVLTELGSFEPGKPVAYAETVVDAVSRWLQDDPATQSHSPFDVLEGVLSTEGFTTTATGATVRLTPFRLQPAGVSGLRDQVVDLALREARSRDRRRAVRGLRAIEQSLQPPIGYPGDNARSSSVKAWTPTWVDIIRRLRPVAQDPADPVVAIATRRALRCHVEWLDGPTHQDARDTLAALPTTLDHEIALALHDGWGHLVDGHHADYEAAEQERRERFERLATATIDTWTDDELARFVQDRLIAETIAGGEPGHPGPFLWTLARARPRVAGLLGSLALADPDSPVVHQLPVVLAGHADVGHRGDAISLARRLVATGEARLEQAVAAAYGWHRGARQEVLDGEEELLLELATSREEPTRVSVAHAARALSASHRAFGVRLLTAIPFSDSPSVAAAVVEPLVLQGSVDWADLSPSQRDAMLDQLVACPAVNQFWIEQFLAHLSERHPRDCAAVLKARVDRAARDIDSVSDYRPLPYHWKQPLAFPRSGEFVVILAEVRDWLAANVGTWQHAFWGGQLFNNVAGAYDAVVLGVIEDGLSAAAPGAVRAAASILRSAPRTLIFDEPDFVRRVLRQAETAGDDALERIGGALHAATLSGVRWGTPGEPFEEDVQQRAMAKRLAESLRRGSVEQRFYRSVEASATERIRWEADRDAKYLDDREW
jgi:transcriptional regulator with XRE-family HTH domain